MKTINIIIISLLFISVGSAQTPVHDWKVIDQGGGKSTSDGMVLHSFVGQPGVTKIKHIDTGSVIQSGFVNIQREYSGIWMLYNQSFSQGWNLVSLPIIPNDQRKSILYPSATSTAFSYHGSYVPIDTINNTEGFWIKYPSPTIEECMGTSFFSDTINVTLGWNMVGSLTYPVAVDSIRSDPTLIKSSFFGYNGTYYPADTLKPSIGYWVKVNGAGRLFLLTSK